MQYTEGQFEGAEGLELYCRQWWPATGPRAIVVLVHGVGEHSGRYMNLVEPLVQAGYGVCGYDHRGHGNSPGPRVHITRWAQYREDLGAFLRMLTDQEPHRSIIVFGHSMGSLIVLDYLMQHAGAFAGMIISGVALVPAGVGNPLQIAMARALSGILPRFPIRLRIDAASLTSNLEAQQAFRSDPRVIGRATARWSTEILDAIARIKQGMQDISLPSLIVHGEADPLNLADGARALYDAMPHPDKNLRIYPGVLHELHNDVRHGQVVDDIKKWLARRSRQ